MTKFIRLSVLFLIAIGWSGFAQAQAPARAQGQRLTVATRVIAPFVTREADGSLGGFSIELWRVLARDLNVNFDFIEKPNVTELLNAVASNQADLAIAAISVTADREKSFDFSQPMFDAGLQIMTTAERAQQGGLAGFINMIKSPALLEIFGILIALILLPVPFIWWIERRQENSIASGKTAVGGLFNSVWWSASTLGAQAPGMPISPLGKFLAVVWMFVGVLFVSYFTATVTAAITVKQLEQSITGPQDLVGKKVATTIGSTGAAYLRQLNIDALEVAQIEQAYAALLDGQAQAIVGDAPVLLYYASHGGKGKVQTAGAIFRPENYGILFSSGSDLRKRVNESLLRAKESGEYRGLYRKWFAPETSDAN